MRVLRKWATGLLLAAFAGLLTGAAPGTASVGATTATPSFTLPLGSYRIINVHSGMCMSVRNASKLQGAVVDQWDCGNYPDQRWTFLEPADDPGNLFIVNVNSGMCLSVLNASPFIGAQVDQWNCGDYPDQVWYLPSTSQNTITDIINHNSNACLSVPNASTQQGVQLDQWDCQLAYVDQNWFFTPWQPAGGARPFRTSSVASLRS